jgi:hypothetical protein
MKSVRICACTSMVLLAFVTARVEAAPIIIYNTGVDATGAVLPDGSADPHYIGFSPVVDSTVSATPAADSISAWIRLSDNRGAGGYTIETNFTMPAAGPITINGQWSAYVSGLDMRINGVSGGNSIDKPGYTDWHPFSISGTAVAGNNTFDVSFAEDFGNPTTGVRVEIFSVVPEPAAPVLLALGAVGLARRRLIRQRD